MGRLSRIVVSLAVLLFPGTVWAQGTNGGLSNLLVDFFVNRPLVLKFTGHEAHFSAATEAGAALGLFNRNIAYQLASFPLGSSSGGFTFTLDPSLGVLSRSAESFGPLFAERALTAGKGKLTIGASYMRSTWDRFEGNTLDAGDLGFTLTHSDLNNDGSTLDFIFEGDVIDARLLMTLNTDTAVVFANYGITDRFDVGVAVPFVRAELDARIRTRIDPLATAEFGGFHEFDAAKDTGCGANRVSASGLENEYCSSGDASGIGDIVVRGKLGLTQREKVSLAAGVDVRLPTGKEEDLLGTGAVQIKPYLIAGFLPKSKFSPHLNVGYTFTGDSDLLGKLPDELNFTVGFDAAPASRVTVTADLVGRSLLDAARLRTRDRTFLYRTFTDPTVRTVTRPEFFAEEGTMNLLLGSAGVKLNPFGRLLVSANVLFPLSKDNGLQDDITPVFAIDYNF